MPYMSPRLRSWIANLALTITATLFILLVAEVVLRLAGQRMIFPQMYDEDPHTVFRLKPNVKVRTVHAGYFDYEYSVNSRGFRNGLLGAPTSDKGDRILFVGDSFTFGVGVAIPLLIQLGLKRGCANGVSRLCKSSTLGWEDSVRATSWHFCSITDGSSNQGSWCWDSSLVTPRTTRSMGCIVSSMANSKTSRPRSALDGDWSGPIGTSGYTWLAQHSTLFN
jgi:hypothetical protein